MADENSVADIYTDWHAGKVVIVGVSYKKRVRIICLKKDKKIKSEFAMLVQIDLLTSTYQ